MRREIGARRIEVREGRPLAAAQRSQRAHHADDARRGAVVQMRRYRGVAEISDAPGDAADVVVEAEDLVNDDDARTAIVARGRRDGGAHRVSARARKRDVLRRHPMILLSGYSMMPTAPASISFGNSSRIVASSITLSIATHSFP